jgi:transcriptional regulator with PAS, ATPase and Fis domain
VIEPEDLHLLDHKSSDAPLTPVIPDEGIALEDIEKSYILKALEKSDQNRSKAARLLKIPRHVLLYRLEKYGL